MTNSITPRIYILVFLFLSMGITKMSNAETWVLDDGPISESEVEATLELYSEERTMGTGGIKKIIESSVTLGKQKVYTPRIRGKEASASMVEPNSGSSSFYLIEIPFTLHPSAGKRNYEDLTIKIDLATNGATAFRMFPNSVIAKEHTEVGFDLSAALAIKGIDIGGSGSYIIVRENIRPLITAFGEGQVNFYWKFERQDGNPLLPGTKRVGILLEVMRGTELINGILHAQGTIKGYFPWSDPQVAIADSYSIKWNLKNAADSLPRTD